MANTLDPYIPSPDKPWTAARVQHLYQRMGFGADLATINAGLTMTPEALVNQIMDDMEALPAPDAPYWANWSYAQYPNDGGVLYNQVKNEFFGRWVSEMLTEGFRSKLALFWHNHFVTEELVYNCNSFMWSYYSLLHEYALGNFKTFVQQMGRNAAMLVYLNGNQNVAAQPNENYARELMELFTMGEGNGYTQNDVVAVARALTGWQVNMYTCVNQVTFNPGLFDNGAKTIFGETGNFNYTSVHNLIFSLRANEVAHYICSKIYKFFVYETPDEAIIQGLADTFKQNDWEIAPVLQQLFQSEHFFEDRFINARIRSPFENLTAPFKLVGAEYDVDYGGPDLAGGLVYAASDLGQTIFNPINVAGWPEYHSWLSENSLTRRWSYGSQILFNIFAASENILEKLRQQAMDLTSPQENDPQVITEALVNFYLNTELDPQLLDTAVLYFKADVPENYFDDGSWNLYYDEVPEQILSLLSYLVRLPEWQLC